MSLAELRGPQPAGLYGTLERRLAVAVPKRKMARSRRNSRRANWKIAAPNTVDCSHCHQPKLPHHVCPNCGYYDGREVIEVD